MLKFCAVCNTSVSMAEVDDFLACPYCGIVYSRIFVQPSKMAYQMTDQDRMNEDKQKEKDEKRRKKRII
jgi:DNA-directed RNA polymerase subunit RPC12/RpoP